MNTTLFTNALLIPMQDTASTPKSFIGAVGVVGNRIAMVTDSASEVEAFRTAHPDCHEVDCTGKVLMPGLINTHCHAAMTLQRSYADDITLMEWLNDYIWPFEAEQTPDEIALGMTLGVVEMLLGGITSFVDMYFHENRCVETIEKLGIRALLGCSYFDHSIEAAKSDALRTLECAKDCDRIRVAMAPHAPYTVSAERLTEGKRFAEEHDLALMIHVAETQDEMRFVREKYHCTPVDWLDSLGLLDERTIAAHCVWVDEKDRATLRERGVIVSHNAQSNMKISSGAAPIAKMVEEGLRVTLATDGPCSNNDLDLWEEMRSAAFLQKLTNEDALVLPAWEVLRMATANGARAMGYADGELGVLCEGALADLIVIDLNKPHLQPIHDVVSNLVYCGKASDVESVMVDGRMVVEERRIKGLDLPTLYAQMAEAVTRIKQAIATKR